MTTLERQLYDMQARAEADPFFAQIATFVLRPRWSADGTLRDDATFAAIQTRVDQSLQGLTKKAGRAGASVIFLMPVGDTDLPNIPGPQLRFVYAARIQENIAINMGPNGTQKSAEEIALALVQLFHHVSLNGALLLFADKDTLTPIAPAEAGQSITYEVRFAAQGQLAPPARCTRPTISPSSGSAPQTVTLTSATAGAQIFYTLDGSYPSPLNGTLYSAPFSIAAACTLRAAASKADSQQSDVAQSVFT